jgi:hypothetical protein
MFLVLVENADYPVTPRRESQKFFHRARIIRTSDSSAWPKFPQSSTKKVRFVPHVAGSTT